MAKYFDCLGNKPWQNFGLYFGGTGVSIDIILYFWGINKAFWVTFKGNPLCDAICTNCFEKCTWCSENVEDDSRNEPKQRWKSVTWTSHRRGFPLCSQTAYFSPHWADCLKLWQKLKTATCTEMIWVKWNETGWSQIKDRYTTTVNNLSEREKPLGKVFIFIVLSSVDNQSKPRVPFALSVTMTASRQWETHLHR